MFKMNKLIKYIIATILYFLILYVAMIVFSAAAICLVPEILYSVELQIFLIVIVVVLGLLDMCLAICNKTSIGNFIYRKIFNVDFLIDDMLEELDNMVRAYDFGK